jgi:hypothetical protein
LLCLQFFRTKYHLFPAACGCDLVRTCWWWHRESHKSQESRPQSPEAFYRTSSAPPCSPPCSSSSNQEPRSLHPVPPSPPPPLLLPSHCSPFSKFTCALHLQYHMPRAPGSYKEFFDFLTSSLLSSDIFPTSRLLHCCGDTRGTLAVGQSSVGKEWQTTSECFNFSGHSRESSVPRRVQIQRSKSRSPEEWPKLGAEEPVLSQAQPQEQTRPEARQGAAGPPPPPFSPP